MIRERLRAARFRSGRLRRPLVSFRHFGVRREDVFVASYPRSGTTWLVFLLYESLTDRPAQFGQAHKAVPYVGNHREASPLFDQDGRLMYTHETVCRFDHRVVYIVRDPRSVVLSEYTWQQRREIHTGSFQRFLERFLVGRTNPWGAWDGHVNYWLNSRSAAADRMLLIRFEDLRRDTEGTLRSVLSFLGGTIEHERIREVIENNSVERMRQKEDSAPRDALERVVRQDIRFVGSGSIHGWREKLTADQQLLITRRFAGTLRRLGYEDS